MGETQNLVHETDAIPDEWRKLPPTPCVEWRGDGKQIAALIAAMAKASGEFAQIRDSETGRIGNQVFKYADLETILSATRPALSKHGLVIMQFLVGPVARLPGARAPELASDREPTGRDYVPETEVHQVVTALAHAEGGMIESSMNYKRASDVKTWGSQTTYLRRYLIRTLLCVDGSDDPDRDTQHDEPRRSRQEPAQPQRRSDPPPARPQQPAAAPAAPPPAQQTPPPTPEEPKPEPAPEPPATVEPNPNPAIDQSGPSTPEQKAIIQTAMRNLGVVRQPEAEKLLREVLDDSSYKFGKLTFAQAGQAILKLQAKLSERQSQTH